MLAQLSFAAVVGILLLAAPLRRAIAARLGRGALRGALAEGAAVTIAATLATAPLIAFHFGTLSTTTLAANLLALPAVAPAMWLGMASAAVSQVPGLPVEVLNWPNALLLAYIAQVASWCAQPDWAEAHIHLDGLELAACYSALAPIAAILHHHPADGPISRVRSDISAPRWVFAMAAVVGLVFVGLGVDRGGSLSPVFGLRVTVLDVGQGDAILLQPAGAPAILVDGGPPGDDLAAKLDAAGVERLAAAVITHDQSDHAGGVEELFGRLPLGRLVYGRLRGASIAAARAAGVAPLRVGEGAELRSGKLRLRVLWPPPELLAEPAPGEDPNQLALVILARWRGFAMLLSADAEAEAVPLDPGPIDVLKVAHHGSEDAGLGELLDRTRPRLAVISVGEGNPYGHPTAAAIATLAAHGVRTLRTDLDGDVLIDVGRRGFVVEAG